MIEELEEKGARDDCPLESGELVVLISMLEAAVSELKLVETEPRQDAMVAMLLLSLEVWTDKREEAIEAEMGRHIN